MLGVDFLGTPAIGDVIEGNLDHLNVGVVNPCAALLVGPDVRRDCGCWHGANVAESGAPDNEVLGPADFAVLKIRQE